MRRRLALVGVLGFFVLAGLLAGLSHMPFLQIDAVQLSGNRTLASTTLTAFVEERLEGSYFYVFPKRNIFLYPKTAIRDALVNEHPLLSAAEVHAVDFHTIAAQVVEREPRALWCPSADSAQAGACYLMDETGAVYAPAPSFSSPVYVEYHGTLAGERWPKQYLQPEQFLSLAALVDAIARELAQEQLDGVTVDRAGDVRMRFENGFDVLFVLGAGEGDIFERFTLALKAEPFAGHLVNEFEYLDLRFGDKLYYKQRQ